MRPLYTLTSLIIPFFAFNLAASALTFSNVALEGRMALQDTDPSKREPYIHWAKEFMRFLAGKDLNFLRTCTQEATPNPTCAIVSEGRLRINLAKSPRMPPKSRLDFFTAVAALDNPQSRINNCKTSSAKLDQVERTPGTARIHARIIYWKWVCARLDYNAQIEAEQIVKSQFADVESRLKVERAQALEMAKNLRESQLNKLRGELSEAEKSTVDEASPESNRKNRPTPAQLKVQSLKSKLKQLESQPIDDSKIKVDRGTIVEFNEIKKKLKNQQHALSFATQLVAKYRTQIWEKYPFGYHSFLIADEEGDNQLIEAVSNVSDPEVVSQSSQKPELNDLLRILEALMRPLNRSGSGLDDLPKQQVSPTQRQAVEVLARSISKDMTVAEPALRLYFSALLVYFAEGNSSILPVVQNLAPLLRDHKEYINRTTLSALYPLNYYVYDARKGIYRTVRELVENNSDRYGLERMDPSVLAALIHQESAFNPAAKSRAGAIGLMQMLLPTAQEEWQLRGAAESVTEDINLEQLLALPINENRLKYDLTRALQLGSGYFESLREQFKGSFALALAAYNWGPSAIQQWKISHPFTDDQVINDLILMDSDREAHASDYVLSILAKSRWYDMLYFSNDNTRKLNKP